MVAIIAHVPAEPADGVLAVVDRVMAAMSEAEIISEDAEFIKAIEGRPRPEFPKMRDVGIMPALRPKEKRAFSRECEGVREREMSGRES